MKQVITDNYAIYNGDCVEITRQLPDNCIDLSIYSPPFAELYTYSNSIADMGNSTNSDEFYTHFKFLVKELARVVKQGRNVCVHCMDIPKNGDMGLDNFPGDIIELHKKNGFKYWDRKNIWKEPLRVAIRTRQRALMHMQLVNDTAKCRGALADYLLIFKKNGENKIPIEKPYGLTQYDGDLELMNKIELEEYLSLKEKYVNYKDDKTNRLSQFIWRRYASSAWEDIRANRALCYKPARDKDDDRHVCPLQLDIVTRSVQLYTNKKEIVFTPFMGVGTEVYGAIINDRMGIGIELKPSYYNQALKNLKDAQPEKDSMSQMELL